MQLISPYVLYCDKGDNIFSTYIPKDHMGQMVRLMVVLQCHVAMYVAAAEICILYKVLIWFPPPNFASFHNTLVISPGPIL